MYLVDNTNCNLIKHELLDYFIAYTTHQCYCLYLLGSQFEVIFFFNFKLIILFIQLSL